jgi:hypothetical protein
MRHGRDLVFFAGVAGSSPRRIARLPAHQPAKALKCGAAFDRRFNAGVSSAGKFH